MKYKCAVPAEAIFCLCCSVCFAVCLLARADVCTEAVRRAVRLCLDTLIPALFPFLALNGVILGAGGAALAARTAGGVFARLFRSSPALCAPFFIGAFAGFPSGAAAVAEVYSGGGCTKDEAERALAFSSNSGPAYAIGGLGALLGDLRLGAVIYAAQLVSALLLARLLPRKGKAEVKERAVFTPPKPGVFTRAVKGAVMPMLYICAFVIVFSPVTALLGRGLEAAGTPFALRGVILSAVELTNGAAFAASALTRRAAAAVCAFALSFSGLCVHAQTASCTAEAGLSLKYYIPGRLFMGAASAAMVWAAAGWC